MRKLYWMSLFLAIGWVVLGSCYAQIPEAGTLVTVAPAAVVDSSAAMLKVPEEAEGAQAPFVVAQVPPRVELALYPEPIKHPDWGHVWSQWGDGVLGPDGRFYSSIGDHGGPDGHSYIYAYNAQERRLHLVVDQQKFLGQREGDWGFGKIHGRLEYLEDGMLYWATYWGNGPPDDYAQEKELYGMVVRADPRTGKGDILGVAQAPYVLPMGMIDHRAKLFYGLPCDNRWQGKGFLVYDLEARETIYYGHQAQERGQRFILIAEERGSAYFTVQPDADRDELWLARYDVGENAVDLQALRLPDGYGTMRAGTERADGRGDYYIVCNGKLARVDLEAGEVEPIGPVWDEGEYTTAVEISPGGRYLYAIPGSHGTAWQFGAPVVQYDLKTGRRKVLAFLGPYYRERYGYYVGGSYCVELSPDGRRLFFGMNGNDEEGGQAFGLPASMLLHIPESERADDAM